MPPPPPPPDPSPPPPPPEDGGVGGAAAAVGRGRLPRTAVPSHYDLRYTSIDLESNAFDGVVTIALVVPDAPDRRDEVVLHSLGLNVISAIVSADEGGVGGGGGGGEGGVAEADEFRFRALRQTCAVVFPPGTLRPGASYSLAVTFSGALNDPMHGLYRSTYESPAGRSLTMATTQFEPTDARRAFPCFDEPALKATFRLTVTVRLDPNRPGLRALSNTPPVEERTEVDGGGGATKTFEFGVTPLMSTYLLALIVGEFDHVSSTSDVTGITTTVYTVPGKARRGRFCLRVASECLDLYASMFGVPYPLKKSDLVAVPDFAAGAMENWGLVTYREAKVLAEEDGSTTSETALRGIARTVCHELAHMWFGNLVTMEFWTQLWLKEGVARYMEFVGIEYIFPEWDGWTDFVQSVYGTALGLDSMVSSHPVEVAVAHPDEIKEIFDAISYAKGASVIRMISSYVGFDAFLRGMKLYLERHAYGNATTEELWDALGEESGLPVAEMASPWTRRTGFPILVLPGGGDDDGGGVIRTPRFLAGGPGSDAKGGDGGGDGDGDGDGDGSWPIPVTAIVQGSSDVLGPWVLNGPSGDQSPELLQKIKEWTKAGLWFKLNASQTGFYRVAYTAEQWTRMSNGGALKPGGQLMASDRLGLISDSFASGRAGYASIVDSLKLARGFGDQEGGAAEYAVWRELAENVSDLANLYRPTDFFPDYQRFMRGIFTRRMEELGWDAKVGESRRTGTLRGTIVGVMGTAGDGGVKSEALRRFRLYVEDGESNPIPADLRHAVFRAAMREDEGYVYRELKRIYEGGDGGGGMSLPPEERRDCLSVMGCVTDPRLHSDMMEYALFSGMVRTQDVAYPLGTLSRSTDRGGRECWYLLRDRIGEVERRYGDGPMWGPCVGLCCGGLRTKEEADEVEEFFLGGGGRGGGGGGHRCGSARRRLGQALERVRTRAARLERDRGPVARFLKEGGGGGFGRASATAGV